MLRISIGMLAALLFPVFCAFSQEKDSLVAASDIRNFGDYFHLGPVMKKRELVFAIASKKDQNSNVSFRPNNSYSIGLSANLFDVSIEAAVSVPLDIKSINRYGESSVKDFQVGALSKKFMADAYWQKYNGFYYTYPGLIVPDNKPFPRRGDIETLNFGASFAYVFNHARFSLRSSYTFLDQQLVSRGSFLLGCVVSSFDILGDSALIPAELHPNNPRANINQIRFSSLGIAPGYSYNLVVKNFFVNATLLIGPAHYWVRYYLETEAAHNDIEINTFTSVRIALGYNSHRFFTGLSYTAHGRDVVFENVKFSNSVNALRLVVGWRFREQGLLKKSIMDVVPSVLKGN